jgi:hypothetical protein
VIRCEGSAERSYDREFSQQIILSHSDLEETPREVNKLLGSLGTQFQAHRLKYRMAEFELGCRVDYKALLTHVQARILIPSRSRSQRLYS